MRDIPSVVRRQRQIGIRDRFIGLMRILTQIVNLQVLTVTILLKHGLGL